MEIIMAFLNSVKILAERLKTHPEEFLSGNKFAAEYEDILLLAQGSKGRLWYLNEQEKEMLILALREVERKKFEDNVLLQLLDEPEQKSAFGLANIVREGAPIDYRMIHDGNTTTIHEL
jgi:hypothetical protein